MADQTVMQDADNKPKRGRPRNSPEKERAVAAERKEKYFGPERNARRREQYAKDQSAQNAFVSSAVPAIAAPRTSARLRSPAAPAMSGRYRPLALRWPFGSRMAMTM